jgi:hypothetical protein
MLISYFRGIIRCGFRCRLLYAALFVFAQYETRADQATLKCAEELAQTYKDYTYGTGNKQKDCVHFVLDVVNCRLKTPVSKEVQNAILIAYGWTDQQAEQKGQEGTDPRIAGVQYALTEISNAGKKIDPKDARPGDIVQYWMPDSDGKWFGHAAVITKVEGKLATLLGAHKSANAVTLLGKPLNLAGADRHIFVVRIGD